MVLTSVFNPLLFSKSEEIAPFSQTDLLEDSIYILDAFFEIYVWIGSDARHRHRDIRVALETALEYWPYVFSRQPERASGSSLSLSKVWLVRSGEETPGFKTGFIAFDNGSEGSARGSGFVS